MPVRFERRMIAHEPFEAAAAVDVDGDGVMDIVCGEFWYQGPDFVRRHPIAPITRHGQYHGDFSAIVMDIDGDGRPDLITGDWWDATLRWKRNPGKAGAPWTVHDIARVGSIETVRAWDVDGDGELEICPNTPGDPLAFWKLHRSPDGPHWTRHQVGTVASGHGLGFGDIDGDGRGEFITSQGWYSADGDPLRDPWTFHPGLALGMASVPIIVADVDGDGLADLIVGNAHGYGLDWYQQRLVGGQRTFTRHPIDPFNSQYHDLLWVDLDGDGRPELVTGKRFRAHNDGDPGAGDDYGLYYFAWTGETFAKQVIAYGPYGVGKGCGIHAAAADLRGTGRLDLIAPGKDGLAVFFNLGTR